MLSQLSYIPTCMCAFAQAHIVLIGFAFVKLPTAASEIIRMADYSSRYAVSSLRQRIGGFEQRALLVIHQVSKSSLNLQGRQFICLDDERLEDGLPIL